MAYLNQVHPTYIYTLVKIIFEVYLNTLALSFCDKYRKTHIIKVRLLYAPTYVHFAYTVYICISGQHISIGARRHVFRM